MSGRLTRDVVLTAVVLAIVPLLVPNSYIFDVVIRIGLTAIAVIGLNILMGLAGQISIGHAAFVAGAAYTSAILTSVYHWSALASIPVAVAAMTLLAFLLAVPMLRLNGHALTIATLGLGLIVHIVLINEVAWTGGPDGLATTPLLLGPFAIDTDLRWYALVATVLLVAVILSRNLDRSAAGRALRTVRDSEIAASAVGVGTYGLKVRAFVISAAFAGLSGALTAHYAGFITPDMTSFLKNVELATMVVVGGRGSTLGAILGAALLTALPQLLGGLSDYEMVAFGLILMTTMIFLPEGIVPSLAAKWRTLTNKRGSGVKAGTARNPESHEGVWRAEGGQ
jgi:branched-chain amino acid transport system permease protein